MLDDNEPQGLARFEATEVSTLEDGTRVYSGPWKVPRPEDPSHVVIVEPTESKTLVYWATQPVKDALAVSEWPRGSRARNEIQENRFKRMIDHGALNTNSGRKKSVGPDRHQHRAREQLEQALAAAQQRVDKKAEAVKAQQDQVAESESKGHGTRLEQRQRALAVLAKEWKEAQHNQDTLAEQASALGPPRERVDRDFRHQTIMTVRTLLLENMWHAFMAVLLGIRQTKVSLEQVRIPRMSATQSRGRLPPSPREACHVDHRKVATQSTGSLPRGPQEGCHLCQAKPATVGAARRWVFLVSLRRLLLSTWAAVSASILPAKRSWRRYAPGGPGSRQPGSDPPERHASAPLGADG
jgi:hypothetical protein